MPWTPISWCLLSPCPHTPSEESGMKMVGLGLWEAPCLHWSECLLPSSTWTRFWLQPSSSPWQRCSFLFTLLSGLLPFSELMLCFLKENLSLQLMNFVYLWLAYIEYPMSPFFILCVCMWVRVHVCVYVDLRASSVLSIHSTTELHP
jgi:hypothetical protein